MEVRFYFQAIVKGIEESLALCSLYSLRDEDKEDYTHGALNVHSYEGENDLIVIRVKTILSIVGMMPFKVTGDFYLTEKFSLGVIDTGDIIDYTVD